MPRITWRYFIICVEWKKGTQISHWHKQQQQRNKTIRRWYDTLYYVFRIQCAICTCRLLVQICAIRSSVFRRVHVIVFCCCCCSYTYVYVLCDLTLIIKIDCTKALNCYEVPTVLPTHFTSYTFFSLHILLLHSHFEWHNFPIKKMKLNELNGRQMRSQIQCTINNNSLLLYNSR